MYLEKIQKVLGIAEKVLKVLMVISFPLGGFIIFCGLVCASGLGDIAAQMGAAFASASGTDGTDLTAEGAVLLAEGIGTVLNGFVLIFTVRYLAKERADGTPFTESGAEAVKKLGITYIVFGAATSFIQGLIIGIFNVTATVNSSADSGITAGLLLLFLSLLLNYGAQLREGRADDVGNMDTTK